MDVRATKTDRTSKSLIPDINYILLAVFKKTSMRGYVQTLVDIF
jgi:hypothetical protein